MSRHQNDRLTQNLNLDQQRLWQDAVAAVEETAANTDHESSSKQSLLTLVELVRAEPEAVVREIVLIRLEPMVARMDPGTSEAMLAAMWDSPQRSLAGHL
jgi:hypothetical protein